MTKRSIQEFSSFFSKTLAVEDIGPDGAMGKTRGWSSLAHVDLILALEDWAGVPISPDLIGELTSVQSIQVFLREQEVLES
ncbi:MAG: acyl carrier protein [Desulfovibrio sp.]|nr:acyl carrier protein [Desulfovibrio sp.]MBI4958099.1 acyl carrier protein [Desulfovibrio sp.]